ncbi:MAG: hypothetical protein WC310_05890, partial [Patescibacteria group bacterium]
MTCKGYQFTVGKTYEHEGTVKLCSSGFHFCEHPLDVFGHYAPSESVYAEIEAENVSDKKESNDTKRVCGKITIVKMLSMLEMAEIAVAMAQKKISGTGDNQAIRGT